MDLSTTYMGLALRNPLVPSSSPLMTEIDNLRRMEDAGAGAVVLNSLFEEQIAHDAKELDFYLQYGADRFAESLSYYPRSEEYDVGPEEYLRHIAQAKHAIRIPVIGSLNGVSAGGWISFAKRMEDAGADALELNVYYIPAESRIDAAQVESLYLMVLQAVKLSVRIPVAIKLPPFFSATANMVARLCDAGADGVVLFNRFLQPDLDIENLEPLPCHALSTSGDNLASLRWIALLHGRVRASLAAANGVHTAQDVAKMILAGADVTMMCSALLQNGIGHLATVRQELEEYMQHKGYESVTQMKGALSQKSCPDPTAFERAQYLRTLQSYGPTPTKE